jgi:outer membrane autotransporter protein
MKKNFLLISAVMLLATSQAFGQFTFSAAPGLNLNSASFGYKMGKVVPYIGIQYCGISGSYTQDVNYVSSATTDETNEAKLAGKIIMPSLGVKVFAIEKNKVKGYFNATIAKPFISAKVSINGSDIEEVTDQVKNVSLIGGTLGVGAEYFFDDNFSLGGEFGLNALFGKYSDTYNDSNYDGNGEANITSTVKALVMPTYSKISLNFYF